MSTARWEKLSRIIVVPPPLIWLLSRLSVLPGSSDSRVPFVISTSITSRLCDRRPPQHCAFPGVPWKTNLFARRQCVRSVYKVIRQSNASLSLPVWVLPHLPGLAVSNERGVWAKLFGCVISFIMPFIGGPRVINKQRSGWLRGVTDRQIVNWSLLGLRGGGYATDDWRGCTVPWCDCCRHLSCWRCDGWGEEKEEEERKRWMAELSRGYVGCWTLWW